MKVSLRVLFLMIFWDNTPGHLIMHPNVHPFFSLFCFQPIFWQMAFLIGWCKENGNFIRKKTSTGSKIWTYSFFWSKYQTKKESQCQRCYCLGQHTNKLYNFRHKSTNITWFFGVFGTILSKWWNSLLLGSELWHHCGWVTILVCYIVPILSLKANFSVLGLKMQPYVFSYKITIFFAPAY